MRSTLHEGESVTEQLEVSLLGRYQWIRSKKRNHHVNQIKSPLDTQAEEI
jgi:hypothetical protein